MIQETIQHIESILNIKLEKDDLKNSRPNCYRERDGNIEDLELDGVYIDGGVVEQLLPHVRKLRYFSLANSTVSNVAELLKLQVYYLYMDQVVFENDSYDGSLLKGLRLEVNPGEVHVKNSTFNAAAWADFKRLAFLFCSNCHISNFYAFNHLPNLYQLELAQVTFGPTKTDTAPKERAQEKMLLRLRDCRVEDMNFFLPFAPYIWMLDISTSQIGGLAAIRQFSKMDQFEIDDQTQILNGGDSAFTEIQPVLEHLVCQFNGHGEKANLEKLAPIADFFTSLYLEAVDTRSLTGISLFSNASRLEFKNCDVYLESCLPIARNITSVYFTDATLHQTEFWRDYPRVDTIKVSSWDDIKGLKSLEPLLPLKNQLKRLSFWEDVEEDQLNAIGRFNSLEILDINPETVIATAGMLSLASLKKLKTNICLETPHTFSLAQLTQLEHLYIEGAEDISFTGIADLKNLTTLVLENTFVDVNQLAPMPQLKCLAFDFPDYHVKGLSQFANLEQLKIPDAKSIQLKNLHQLKILDLSNTIYVDQLDCFDDLPQLEKLELSSIYNQDNPDIIDLRRLSALKNLKWLSLMESEIKSLDGIEALTSLEYLDLYYTGLTDVTALNQLPRLKEVNLATNNHQSRFELQTQLDKPEVAQFIGLPRVHFRVWEEEELWENYH